MQASLSAPARIDKRVLLIGLLIVWIALRLLAWQPLLKPLPALSVLVTLAIYITPGALLSQLAFPDRTFYPLRTLTVGFALSIPLTAVLGILALVFHLTSLFIINSLFWISTVLLVLLILRGGARLPAATPRTWANWLLLVFTAITIALSAALTFSNSTYEQHVGDDETYDAQAQSYAYDDRLGFEEPFLGTDAFASPRLWFQLWPMSEAVMTHVSGLHLFVLNPILKAYFAILALLSLYELARAMGLSSAIASLGVIGQMAWLYVYLRPEQYSYYTINQDKRLLVAIVAPVIFRLMLDVFRDRKHLKLLAAVCFGAVLTHVTMFALTVMVCGLYCVGEMLLFRRYKTAILVIVVFAVTLGVMLPMRFIERRYSFQLPSGGADIDAVTQDTGPERREGRLNIIPNTPFYGLDFPVLNKRPFHMVYIACLVALFFLRRSAAARFLVAFGLLVVIEVFPLTGWIIGLGITPYHLWRIQWMIPVGLGWAFLIYAAAWAFPKLLRWQGLRRFGDPALAALGAASLIVVFNFWGKDAGVQTQQALIAQGLTPDTGYGSLVQLGELLDRELPAPTIVIAEGRLSSLLPALSHNAKTVLFRGNQIAAMQTSIPPADLRQRDRAFRQFFDSSQSSAERITILDTYNVRLIITDGRENELVRLTEDYPDRVVQIAQIGEYQVFRYTPQA